MKTNAIFRIIIWSLVIVILVGMLVAGLYRPGHRLGSETPAATEVAIPLDEGIAVPEATDYPWDTYTTTDNIEATVTANGLNVRSVPSSDSPIVGMVEKGEVVCISLGVQIGSNYERWLKISNPVAGWIKAEYVDSFEDVIFYSSEELRSWPNTGTVHTAVANTQLPVYSAPNTDLTTTEVLEKGTAVTFSRQETVNDMDWIYITSPVSGWVPADLLEESTTIAAAASPSDLSFDPRQIREIDIEWAAGAIRIETADIDTIQVTETGSAADGKPMVWKQSNDKLVLRYSESATVDFNLGTTLKDITGKDLHILVPLGWECDSLEVDAASAALEVYNLTVSEVDFDGASGLCSFSNCVIGELDVDTASGDISFFGSLETLDCDAASASVNAVFENVPSRIDMDSMSGDLDITLPSSAGFEVSMDAFSSDFQSELDYYRKNGNPYRGNGECRINMSAMSGDLYIREYREAVDVPASTETTE